MVKSAVSGTKALASVRNVPRREIGGRFADDPVKRFISELEHYRPTVYLQGILKHTRFDSLFVDRVARALLDLISPAAEISETSFLEDIDRFFEKHADGREIRMFQVVSTKEGENGPESFDLVIVGNTANVDFVNQHLPVKK